MIRVTIEIFPHGNEAFKRTLATADIWNDGCGTPFLGSYGYRLRGRGGRVFRAGYLGEFKRSQFTVWWLLAAVLEGALGNVSKCFRDKQMRHRKA